MFNLGPLLGEFSALTCLYVCLTVRFFLEKKLSGPQGPPVIFSDNILHTIFIIIHFQTQIEKLLGPQNTKYFMHLRVGRVRGWAGWIPPSGCGESTARSCCSLRSDEHFRYSIVFIYIWIERVVAPLYKNIPK